MRVTRVVFLVAMNRLFRPLFALVAVVTLVSSCTWFPSWKSAGPVIPVFGFGTTGQRSILTPGGGRAAAAFFLMTPLLTGFAIVDGYPSDPWTVSTGLPFGGTIDVSMSLADGLVVYTAVPTDPADESIYVRIEYDEAGQEFSIEQHFLLEDPTGELSQGDLTAFVYFKGEGISIGKDDGQVHYHGLVDVGAYVYANDVDTGEFLSTGMQFRNNEIYRGRIDATRYGVGCILGDTVHIDGPGGFPVFAGTTTPSGIPDVAVMDQYAQYFRAADPLVYYDSDFLLPYAYYRIDGEAAVAIEPAFEPGVQDLPEVDQWSWFFDSLPNHLEDSATLPYGQ